MTTEKEFEREKTPHNPIIVICIRRIVDELLLGYTKSGDIISLRDSMCGLAELIDNALISGIELNSNIEGVSESIADEMVKQLQNEID